MKSKLNLFHTYKASDWRDHAGALPNWFKDGRKLKVQHLNRLKEEKKTPHRK